MTINVDPSAPVTAVTLNGAAPPPTYAGAVNVALAGPTPAPACRHGVPARRRCLAAYSAPFSVAGAGVHPVEYRRVDGAGNAEAAKQVAFERHRRVGAAAARPARLRAAPAPSRGSRWCRAAGAVARLRGGKLRVTVRCQAVDRGTCAERAAAAARQLGLRSRVLAQRLRDAARRRDADRALKPGARVRSALRARRGPVRRRAVRVNARRGAASDTRDGRPGRPAPDGDGPPRGAATGRRSRWVVIAAWLVLAAALAPLQPQLSDKAADENEAFVSATAESTRADALLDEEFELGAGRGDDRLPPRGARADEADVQRIDADARALCDAGAIRDLAR